LLRIISIVDFCRIILYFARTCAFPSLFARILSFEGARTIATPMASMQRRVMVAALLGGHVCEPLRRSWVVCFSHRTEAIPPNLSKPLQTMKTELAEYLANTDSRTFNRQKARQIPMLTEEEFCAAFLLFSEGMRVNPELSRSPAVMGALNAFRNAKQISVKLPGEQ
jgi:hypothetical protein